MQGVFFLLFTSFRHTSQYGSAGAFGWVTQPVNSIFHCTKAVQATKPVELAYNRSYLTQFEIPQISSSRRLLWFTAPFWHL